MHDDEKGKVIRGSTLGRFIHDSIWVSSWHRYARAATAWRDGGSCAAPALRAVPGCPLLREVLLDALTGEGFSHTCGLRPLTCVGTMLGIGAAASRGGGRECGGVADISEPCAFGDHVEPACALIRSKVPDSLVPSSSDPACAAMVLGGKS